MKNNIKGVTLLEALLGLVIIATIAMMGLRYYQRYQVEQDFRQIENNVDILFQSLRIFYQANCQKGVLSPFNATPPDLTLPFPIDTSTAFQDILITPGFLTKQWPFRVGVVDDTYGFNGYSVKLIPVLTSINRVNTACFQFSSDTRNPPQCYRGEASNRQRLIWKFEISVQINNVGYAQAYGPTINTSCIVDSVATDVPVNCAVDESSDGQILVWNLLPSDPFLRPRSDAWLLNPVVKNFNLLYTHDPMYEMYDPNSKPNPITGNDTYQYYLCGG